MSTSEKQRADDSEIQQEYATAEVLTNRVPDTHTSIERIRALFADKPEQRMPGGWGGGSFSRSKGQGFGC